MGIVFRSFKEESFHDHLKPASDAVSDAVNVIRDLEQENQSLREQLAMSAAKPAGRPATDMSEPVHSESCAMYLVESCDRHQPRFVGAIAFDPFSPTGFAYGCLSCRLEERARRIEEAAEKVARSGLHWDCCTPNDCRCPTGKLREALGLPRSDGE